MRYIVTLLFMCLFHTVSPYAFDLGKLVGDVVVSEKSSLEKDLAELKKTKKTFQDKAQSSIRNINSTLSDIEQELNDTKIKIESASGSYEELLHKKINILNNRKQKYTAFKDAWKEIDPKIANHIKLVTGLLESVKTVAKPKDVKIVYSWKDLNETKAKLDQLAKEIGTSTTKKETIKKQKTAAKGAIASLKKDIEAKRAEKEKIAKEIAGLSEKEEGVAFINELRAKAEVVEQEILYFQESIEEAELKIETLVLDEQYIEDEIIDLKQKLKKLNTKLSTIQKKLIIDVADVELTKADLEKVKKEAAAEKNKLAYIRNERRGRRDSLNEKIKRLEMQFDQIKKVGKEESAEGLLVESRLTVVRNEKNTVERDLDFLEAKHERWNIAVNVKQLKFKIIEVLHNVSASKEEIDGWHTEFKAKMKASVHAKKVLQDRRDEIANLTSSTNVSIEALVSKKKKMENEREKLRGAYAEIMTNTDAAIKILSLQRTILEKYHSLMSDLVLRQEELLNQYSFIVKHLEGQKAEGLWKRSSRAISMEQLAKSLLNAEGLFKGLFWDTPEYLGPNSIIAAVKACTFADYMGMIIFFILYILLFLILRILLSFAYKKSDHAYVKRFAVGLKNFGEFLLNHFGLIFTWFFVYLHIALGLIYFKPLANAYSATIFYLVSIPILIYLSSRFVGRLRTINEQLGYLFISEQTQSKVTLLIELFLYATSILLPLRSAFLEYFDARVPFTDVSLAAYSLILIVLVLLFFNKEDVLKLLSSQNALVMWLRKKVDKYYYPVFMFCMFLLILSNSYIGYSNFAWFLLFAVPASLFVFYGLFVLHYIIRKYSLFFFIKEEDDEVINKFEHAKAYYGLFVTVTFVLLLLGILVILARIWGFEGYTLRELWHSLSEDWVIPIGVKGKLGFVEFIKLGMFITSGLVISSLTKKFILGRLFAIFRTEPGVQNTVSKILHYCIIVLAIIFGFTAINLSQYALAAGTLLLAGVAFGIRDQIADYFAGILVLIERPLEIGHYVETDEYEGKVHRISARSTTLKTARNLFITIPNRDIIAKPIVNWGKGRYAVGCELQVMVSYDSDVDLVKKVLLELMKSHSMVLRVPSPIVRFEGFESSALYFYCRCYVSSRKVLDMWDLQSDLRSAVVKTFKEQGIVIPYQQTVVHFADKKNPEMPNPISVKFDKE